MGKTKYSDDFIREFFINLGVDVVSINHSDTYDIRVFFKCPNCGTVRDLSFYEVFRNRNGTLHSERRLLCDSCLNSLKIEEHCKELSILAEKEGSKVLRHYSKPSSSSKFGREVYVVACKHCGSEIVDRFENFFLGKRSFSCKVCNNKSSKLRVNQREMNMFLTKFKKQNNIPLSYQVHHIFQVNKYPEYAYTFSNLIPLTPYEHYLVHQDVNIMKKYDTEEYKNMPSLLGRNREKIIELLKILSKPGLRFTKQNKLEKYEDLVTYIQNMYKEGE